MTVALSSRRSRRRIRRHLVLAPFAVLMLIPLYLLIVNSFKGQKDIVASPFGAHRLTVGYLKAAISSRDYNVVSAYGVTALLVVLVTAGDDRIRRARLVLDRAQFVDALPAAAGRVPVGDLHPPRHPAHPGCLRAAQPRAVRLAAGLVLVDLANSFPFAIFLFAGYLRSIPTSLDEAAKIDGCSTLGTFWRVIFPL